jgi:iron complex outermembrane recepter protein
LQSFHIGGWNVTARENRYGDFCSFTALVNTPAGPLPLDDQIHGAKWLADLDFAYNWGKYLFGIGVENVFDTVPDKNLVRRSDGNFTAQSNNGIFTYPSHSPFGMNGRFVYTRIGYTF